MKITAKKVQKTYLNLVMLSTFATAFIFGINTLFLLDGGLSITEAFAANAFFTLGQVIFEVPTGVVADTWGRRVSYLMGAASLAVTVLMYYFLWTISGPFYLWAITSALMGLGFTFFTGATEAWLVDALNFTKFKGNLDDVFAKGQVAGGIAMLSGSVLGGVIAQFTSLGVPYILRFVFLVLTFIVAAATMKDLGFKPRKNADPIGEMKKVLKSSVDHGFKNKDLRYLMLSSPFIWGVSMYAFYAMQPYLLELWGDPGAYSVAGLAASIIASAQIVGGMSVPKIRKMFSKRTNVLITSTSVSVVALLVIGLTTNFYVAVIMLMLWGMSFAASGPIRSAYMNSLIPSSERATVLSFDSLLGSVGGVVSQPGLGKVADVYSYSTSYIVLTFVQVLALPFIIATKMRKSSADIIDTV